MKKIAALAFLAAGLGNESGMAEGELAVGADAPKLEATDHNGKKVDLGAAFGQGLTLVYFFPKALTGG